jgi:ferredoxin
MRRRTPVVDLRLCTDCDSCIEVCPAAFRRNSDTGLIEVIDLQEYPVESVEYAINLCPADCISWEEL